MGPGIAVLVAALALIALIPTRRLHHAGWRAGRLATYWVALTLLGVLVAELRGPARFLLPVYLVAFGAPFVTFRAGLDRLRGRDAAVTGPGPVRRVGPADDGSSGDTGGHRSS